MGVVYGLIYRAVRSQVGHSLYFGTILAPSAFMGVLYGLIYRAVRSQVGYTIC
jgi:hypothetical protein